MSTIYTGYVIIRNFASGGLSDVTLTWSGGSPKQTKYIANDLSLPSDKDYSQWVAISPAKGEPDSWTFDGTMPDGKAYSSGTFDANMDNYPDCVMVVSVDTDGKGGYRLIMYRSNGSNVPMELQPMAAIAAKSEIAATSEAATPAR